MLSKILISILLITSVLGQELEFQRRRNCKDCSNYWRLVGRCKAGTRAGTNLFDCFCTNDDLWSYSTECARCIGSTITSNNQRSSFCNYATDSNILSSLSEGAAYGDIISSLSVPASTTDSSESSKTEDLQTSSETSMSTRGTTNTAVSHSLGGESTSQSSSDGTMTSNNLGSESNSQSSSGDGNTLFASRISLGSLLAYVLLML